MTLFRGIRPSPAVAVAVAALVFAMTGYAVGVPKPKPDRDEVEIQTTTGGPTQSVDPDADQPIPIADPTFTQRAGEVALVSVDADITAIPAEITEPRGCDLFVSVVGDTGSGVLAQDLGFELVELDQRGDPTTKTADSQALPAPNADREVTLEAFVTERIVPDEQGNPVPDEGQCDDDTFTVSLDVSVTTLRN